MVVTNGETDNDGTSSSKGSPGGGTSVLVGESGEKVLEDIQPNETGVDGEGNMDKDVVDEVGGGEDVFLDVESPDEHCVDDRQKLAHNQPFKSLFTEKGGSPREKERERESKKGWGGFVSSLFHFSPLSRLFLSFSASPWRLEVTSRF